MESNNNNDFGKIIRNVGLFIGIPLVFFLILWLFLDPRTSSSNVKYSDYVAYFENNQVESYTLDLGNGNLELTLREAFRTKDINKDGKIDERDYVLKYTVPDVSLFVNDVGDMVNEYNRDPANKDSKITYDYKPVSQLPWIVNLIPSLLIVVIFIAMWVMMRRSLSSIDGGGQGHGLRQGPYQAAGGREAQNHLCRRGRRRRGKGRTAGNRGFPEIS